MVVTPASAYCRIGLNSGLQSCWGPVCRRPVSPSKLSSEMRYWDVYDPESDFDLWYTRAAAEVIVPFVREGDRVLELGCGTGVMTAALTAAGASVVAVERYERYLKKARQRGLPDVSWVHADLDSWTGTADFHHVV